MARLDVHPRPGPAGRGYLLDVPSNLLSNLKTRVVCLLLPIGQAPPPVRDLNPIFDIDTEPHVLLTQSIASVPARNLRKRVFNLEDQHDEITRALDVLLIGI